jgi:gliding motility-associated-like protein
MSFEADKSEDYYILIEKTSGGSYASCLTFDIAATVETFDPPVLPSCSNADFESGSFASWQLTHGESTIGYQGDATPRYTSIATGRNPDASDDGHLVHTGGSDEYGSFPRVYPDGGTYSVQIGNRNIGKRAERIAQKFQVSASNASFTYHYAVVFEKPDHDTFEQPFFKARLRDQDGETVACSEFVVAAASGLPGFQKSTKPSDTGEEVYYKTWSAVNVDLSDYVGQEIVAEFTVGDCSVGGHFGYAYIDATCSNSLLAENDQRTVCQGQSTTLQAPEGYQSYVWQKGAPDEQTGQSFTVSPAATTTYSLELTSYNGCKSDKTATVQVNDCSACTLSAPSPTVSGASCSDNAGGSATITPSGGSGSYIYRWTDSNGQEVSTSATASGLMAGATYAVTVTDNADATCSINEQIVVPPLTLGGANLVVNGDFEDFSECPGISDIDKATGWRPPNNTPNSSNPNFFTSDYLNACSSVTGVPDNMFGSQAAASGVGYAGILTYTQSTDANGKGNKEYIVTELPTPLVAGKEYDVSFKYSHAENRQYASDELGVYISAVEPANYASDGHHLAVTPQISTPSNTYLLNQSGWTEVKQTYVATGGERFLVLGAFHSNVPLLSNPGAFSAAAYYYIDDVAISERISGGITAGPDVTINTGESAQLQVAPNGSAPLSYAWTANPPDPSLSSGASAQNPTVSPTQTTTYTVTADFGGGCTATDQMTVTVNPVAPCALTIDNQTINPASCSMPNSASASVSVSGGSSSYVYRWTDSNGQEVSNTATITGLTAGATYTITVMDNTDATCSVNEQIMIPLIDCPTPCTLSIDELQSTEVTCQPNPDGTTSAVVSGGTGSYTYRWTDSNGTEVSNAATAVDLSAGYYTLTLTDEQSCTASGTVTVTNQNCSFCALSAQAVLEANTGCGNTATITAQGGSGAYVFSSNVGTLSSDGNTATLTDLPGGTHTVQIVDANDATCTTTAVIAVPITTVLALAVSATASDCEQPTGSASVQASGGQPPYQYTWVPTGGNEAMATGLAGGVYTVMVTDAAGCAVSSSVPVEPVGAEAPSVFLGADTTICEGSFLVLDASFPGANYQWQNGSSQATYLVNRAGTYTVTVSNSCGSQQLSIDVGMLSCEVPQDNPPKVLIANALTPNGDGQNDTFFVENIERYPGSELIIYNRWGSVVYRATGYRNQWDGMRQGRRLPTGAYYYVLYLHDAENATYSGSISVLE